MKTKQATFQSKQALNNLIENYFNDLEKEVNNPATLTEKKTITEPATITGLALYLGFNSRQEFDEYENTGKFGALIKRARFRVEGAYEKKLHSQPSSGVIFALKTFGWADKNKSTSQIKSPKTLKIKIIESGPKPAADEKEVVI